MSEITPEITEEKKQKLSILEIEITKLWNSTEDAVDQVHDYAKVAIVAAWECGKRLSEVKKILGHGNFGLWQVKMNIVVRTAQRYMALADKYDSIDALPESKRDAYLAIGLLPEKEKIDHEGDISLQPVAHYLSIINRFENWRRQIEGKKIEMNREQARKDFQPVYEWLKKEIYGE